jgi:hypothetical protein
MGRKPWFGRNRVGFGYHPQTLGGWAVLAVLTAILVLTGKLLGPRSPGFFAAIAAMAIVPILIITYQRGW